MLAGFKLSFYYNSVCGSHFGTTLSGTKFRRPQYTGQQITVSNAIADSNGCIHHTLYTERSPQSTVTN